MIIELTEKKNTAILVSIATIELSQEEAENHLSELKGLCTTLGLVSLEEFIVPIREIQSRYFIGRGWAEEIASVADLANADCIVFDDDLSPSQQRNLETLCKREVLDRHQIILEIFALRAQTKEARLQVELAQQIYNLPRLQKMWSHLSRQQGGAKGTRGEGETQLEVDRRIVVNRIRHLRKELKTVLKQRQVLRKQRESVPFPTAAIVGYTNAGKSSLHRVLTKSKVLIEDKLFATLDPTARAFKLPSGQKILLTDTVGFIRKLPHDLVDAFKSTLEESQYAHFLIHLVDASSPELEQNIETTNKVLQEIGADGKPELLVFNKCDRLVSEQLKGLQSRFPQAICISAKTLMGIDELQTAIKNQLKQSMEEVRISLPIDSGSIIALVHREGQVISTEYKDDEVILHAYLPTKLKLIIGGQLL